MVKNKSQFEVLIMLGNAAIQVAEETKAQYNVLVETMEQCGDYSMMNEVERLYTISTEAEEKANQYWQQARQLNKQDLGVVNYGEQQAI